MNGSGVIRNREPSFAGYLGFDGSFVERVIPFITESGGVVSCNVEQDGGGNLTLIFGAGRLTFNSDPVAQVTLVHGTDEVPVENWVYIDNTGTLIANQSGFPTTEIATVGVFLVQSAASVATEGVYKNQPYRSPLKHLNGPGHIPRISEWIREQPATWLSGVAPSLVITPGAPDTVIITFSAGSVLRLHPHMFPEFSGTPDIYTINDFTTPYNIVNDLNELLIDSLGVSMSDRFFSLVFWGAINQDTGESKIFCNLPSGSYNTLNALASDALTFTNYMIPPEFTGVGFLICEIKFEHSTSGGGTWTAHDEINLRGISTASLSSATGSIVPIKSTEFSVDTDANYLDYRVQSVGANGIFRSTFKVPDDFNELVKLVMDVSFSVALAAQDIDLTSDYHLAGEVPATNSESDLTSTYTFPIEESVELDLSSVFSSLVAKHICGVTIDHKGIASTGRYFKIFMEYI